jgi:hypothetical protein
LAVAKQFENFDLQAYLRSMFAERAITEYLREIEETWEKTVFELLENWVPPAKWDDFGTGVQSAMYIDATTWKPKQLFPLPTWRGHGSVDLKEFKKYTEVCPVLDSEDRLFVYANRALPRGKSLKVAGCNDERGRVFFDGEVATPVLFEIDRDGGQTVWMGLTPMEVITQRPGIWAARGRVVVGGLGLGWFLNAVCAKPEVTEVILVEKEERLLHWLKPAILAAYPHIAHKCKQWVAGDVYEFMKGDSANHGSTCYLLDIWPNFKDCQEDPQFKQWTEKLAPQNLWGWGQ